jgi:hypothetical protein
MAYVSQEMKSKLAPTIKAILKKYKMKGSISVRNHSTLAVTLKEGAINFGKDYIDVNPYWIHDQYEGKAKKFLTELLDAMKGPEFFDRSDSMTDYFCRSHYQSISIGKWDKPYTVV